MKSLAMLLFSLLSICFMPPLGFSETYTVCSSGCDSTTISGIFTSFNLNGGDIVEVQADAVGGSKTYRESIEPGSDDGGAAGNPVIIRARSSDDITISGSDYGVDTRSNGVYYITIDGFTFTNTSSYIMYLGESGSSTYSSPIAEEITIQNCLIIGNTNHAIFGNRCSNSYFRNNTILTYDGSTPDQSDGIALYRGANNVIEGNKIVVRNDNNLPHVDCVQTAWEKNLTIRNNYLEQDNTSTANKQFIITAVGEGYVRIYNNMLYKSTGNTGSYAILIKQGPADSYTLNNTLLISGTAGGIIHRNTGEVNIQNNAIKIGNSSTAIWLDGGTQEKANIHHNCIWTEQVSKLFWRDSEGYYSLSEWAAEGGGVGSMAQEPEIENNGWPKSSLAPVVDTGVSQTLFDFDKNGIFRPEGIRWDIGAYEMAGNITPPRNLRIVE